jgi:hypothetical protein
LFREERRFAVLPALTLAFVLTLTAALPLPAYADSEQDAKISSVLSDACSWILNKVTAPTLGSPGGEWSVLALARGGATVPEGYYEGYLTRVEAKVKANGGPKFDPNKSTENSRLILGLSSLGIDASSFGGYDLCAPLSDYNYVKKQGINGPIYALIALDTRGYAIPAADANVTQTTRENLIDYILDKEIGKGTASAGGWALSGTTPDPDMTGMALQALAPYCAGNAAVSAAAIRAVEALSAVQQTDGGYIASGNPNAESCAQVITALSVLGIDAASDARFDKGGKDPVDALLSFAAPGGGFRHVAGGDANLMATEQGTYALVAYERYRAGKNALYAMGDAVTVNWTAAKPEDKPEDKPDNPEDTPENKPDKSEGKPDKPETESEDKSEVKPALNDIVSKFRAPFKTIYMKRNTSLTPIVLADMKDGSVKTAKAAKVEWKSSNAKVVSVNAKTGKITVKKRTGTATLTGTVKGVATKVSFKVKVVAIAKKLKKAAVKGTPKTLSLKSGKTAQLKVSVNPASATNVTIGYKSSNNKILEVDACGKLTPLSKGKAKITVTIKGGGVKKTIKTKPIQIT